MVVAVLLALGVTVGQSFGVRPLVEQSGSMLPTIAPGDLVLSREVPAHTVVPGDVVSFSDVQRGGILITHRVAAVQRTGDILIFDTRGDSNSAGERWTAPPTATLGLTVFVIPHLGVAVATLGTPLVSISLVALVTTSITLMVVGRLRRRSARPAWR